MKISISDRNSDAAKLATFFSSNIRPTYISHSELQGYRAIRPDEFSKDIASVLRSEISERLHQPLDRFPQGNSWAGVIEAHSDTGLVGLSFVTISRAANVPFGVIEDIVIDSKCRGQGLGEILVRWIFAKFSEASIHRIFLESGNENESAHRLFKRVGFKQISVVMMRDGDDR
jgi:ribosomal protein S18 acetylase RimI-like enzyme